MTKCAVLFFLVGLLACDPSKVLHAQAHTCESDIFKNTAAARQFLRDHPSKTGDPEVTHCQGTAIRTLSSDVDTSHGAIAAETLIDLVDARDDGTPADPVGFTLHPRPLGDEYPAIGALGLRGSVASKAIVERLTQGSLPDATRRRLCMALIYADQGPEAAIAHLKQRLIDSDALQTTSIQKSIQFVLEDPRCRLRQDGCLQAR